MNRLYLLFAAVIITTSVHAQSGTLKGIVTDAVSGEAIIGASIYVSATAQGAATDINGAFEIPKVKAGTYDLVVSFISYKTDTLRGITVYPDQTTDLNHKMMEEGTTLNEVVIGGQRVTNTDFAVISEIRNNNLVMVGISSQQISMSQDRDAAQIIKRIPGVTILNNRFVNIRGLSERYNTVLLNGVIAPSTEVDSTAFAFDMIPSNMIDRMMVYQSGGAEMPGEFGGGIISIHTKSVVEENTLTVNLTTGFRAGTTFRDFNAAAGSATDLLGYDNGFRQLPSSFPSENLRVLSDNPTDANMARLIDASKSLPNRWDIQRKTAAPDLRGTINFAHVFNLGEKKLSNITSLNYSKTYQSFEQENYYYDAFNPTSQVSGRRYYFDDNRYQDNVRIGLISNFILELTPSHKIEFRNLLNQQGSSQVTTRTGIEDLQGSEVNNRAINYFARRIYSGQLQGKHNLGDHFYFTWIGGYSNVNADQPDFRRIRSQRSVGTNEPFAVVIPPGANSLDAGRFYSDLTETVYTGSINADYKLNPAADEEKQAKISVGGYVAKTERNFAARWMSYKWARSSNTSLSVPLESFETIFRDENIGYSAVNGQAPYFLLEEGTSFSDAYTGANLLAAGYASAAIPIADRFRLSTGVRVEYNKQELNSYDTDGSPIVVNNPVTSVLPFFNFAYNYSERSLIRLAYSKTVNRPVFRELAPFNFYDFDRNANLYGNPYLKTADIHNVDLRWENYPTKAENISVGVFYKHFTNPIESELKGGANIVYTYRNAVSARTFGVEVETRKSLNGLTNSGFVDKLSVVLNAALIDSKVDLGNVGNQEKERAMQGQSPYIVNAGLNFNDVATGWQVNASYNIFGKRIFAVGDLDQNATQYEMPRHQLDFTISKMLSNRWDVKLGVQDALNAATRITQDSNRDRKITSVDEPISYFRTGQYISLGVTFKVY